MQEDLNSAGIESSLLFTNYAHDLVTGKYFAQARFYDAERGRMLGRDPIKRGMNAYPYCKNDPINYVDPTGEIANIIGGGILGALVGSGAGIGLTLASNFVAGATGNALEQKIGRGSVNLRESITSGLTNAASGAIYGNNPLRSAGDALRRGVGAGAATAAINHLSNGWDTQTLQGGSRGADASRMQAGMITQSSYGRKRDPRSGCGAPSPFNGRMSYGASYGYQYKETSGGTDRSKKAKSGGFSIVDFAKDVMVGGLMGGLSSVTFYGAGKAVSAVRNSVKGSTKPENIAYRAINQKDYDRYTQGLGLEAKNPNGNWGLKNHIVNGSGRASWSNDPYISTTTDLSVAQGFNNSGSKLGIAVINMDKVSSASYKGYEIFTRQNGVEGLPYHYSIWQQETSVYKNIPYEAIIDLIK